MVRWMEEDVDGQKKIKWMITKQLDRKNNRWIDEKTDGEMEE